MSELADAIVALIDAKIGYSFNGERELAEEAEVRLRAALEPLAVAAKYGTPTYRCGKCDELMYWPAPGRALECRTCTAKEQP